MQKAQESSERYVKVLETLKQIIKDKSVLILGFGREGKSTLTKILEVGGYSCVAVSDMNPIDVKSGLERPLAARVMNEGIIIDTISGENYLNVLDNYDVVFKSPGVVLPKDISEYQCDIVSQTEVFFRHYKQQIIGITGTKGKSTTTTLLYHILKEAGKKTVLAGNIGIPVFDVAEHIEEDSLIVVELSCHQLEYMTVSPHIGVLMNIFEEHLDHYGTMEKYVAAKENIYRNQVAGDVLICNEHNLPKSGTCMSQIISIGVAPTKADICVEDHEIIYDGSTFTIPVDEMNLIGHHNYFDIGIDYAICKKLGISDEDFRAGVCSYVPLPHRLQPIGIVDGVKYYDDSISTICETTIQALESLKKAETVIIGGMDRGIDYEDLEVYLDSAHVHNIILMEATGHRIYEEIMEYHPDFHKPERLIVVEHLEDAVAKAKEMAKSGEICVMSPAAASYGIFKNFEERGDVFKKLVLEA